MGLGKTIQTIAFLKCLCLENKVLVVVVVIVVVVVVVIIIIVVVVVIVVVAVVVVVVRVLVSTAVFLAITFSKSCRDLGVLKCICWYNKIVLV